ncbi:MAG: tetratricopeptide repeat protein [Betaproteobacteria bacterium]|nr:tetratricopeptide repeat protein [Betaproteobacteria bacterium]
MRTPTAAGTWAYRVMKLKALAALVFGRRGLALELFNEMLQRWPGDAYVLASRAHLHSQDGAREAALADLQALVAAWPQRSAGDWFNLAFLLDAENRLAEAEGAFRQALSLDAKLDRAWYGLGLCLIRMQRLDEAIAALKRNTELQPMSPYGWYQLARVHMERQDPDQARRIIAHLKGFEPKVAAQLERETGLMA